LVTYRDWGRRIVYAQVIPGERAGTVTVTLDATEGGSDVEVVYEDAIAASVQMRAAS
jgi:hypothetical protein